MNSRGAVETVDGRMQIIQASNPRRQHDILSMVQWLLRFSKKQVAFEQFYRRATRAPCIIQVTVCLSTDAFVFCVASTR